MNFNVRWLPVAERELARIWTDAIDRRAVTEAAFEIDGILRDNPEEAGESREGPMRILHMPPLGVRFAVLPDDRVAVVVSIWQFRIRSDG